jgi:branched-chain amino acid transport system permease protein
MLSYLVAMATLAAIYALMALGLSVMWGMAGLVNLGIVGFFALGGYASALGVLDGRWPIGIGWIAAMTVAAIAGALTCLALTRLRDDYFAIVTLGFAEVLRIVADNEIWLTRGSDGISGIPQPLKAQLGSDFNLFYLALTLVLLAAALLLTERMRTSPFGRVLRGIRDDPQVVAVAGKNVLWFKMKAFAAGGALAGLSGALYGHYTSYIAPELFQPILTIYVFLAVAVGGKGNNFGAVAGTFVVIFFLESSRFVTEVIPGISATQVAAARGIAIGLALLLVLRLRPRGAFPEQRTLAPVAGTRPRRGPS